MTGRLKGLVELGYYGSAKWRVSDSSQAHGLDPSALKVWIWIIHREVAVKARRVLETPLLQHPVLTSTVPSPPVILAAPSATV